MNTDTWINIGLVLAFVLIGGVFAGTEFALVSLRESQLAGLERRGPRGARAARVARDPNRFLAAVQIGVTVAGFLSAAYGASTLAPDFAPLLASLGLPHGAANVTSFILLTLTIAYLSLVLGELVPKRLAMQRPTQIALVVGPPLDTFATLVRPVVWLLSHSTNLIVRLLGADPTARGTHMTEEELRDTVIAHEGLPDDERQLLTDVFAAADRTVAEAMRPRREVAFLTTDLTVEHAAHAIEHHPYSRYPVIGTDFDDVIGYIHVRDLLTPLRTHTTTPLTDLTRPILEIPFTVRVLDALTLMRAATTHIAIVIDEYGGTDGIVTLEDLIEELVGDIQDEHDPHAPPLTHDTYDAGLTLEEFTRTTGIPLDDGPYETVAGYILTRLGRLARTGDTITLPTHTLTVTTIDDKRIRTITIEPTT